MEKDIGKIKKNENTDILVRVDDFGGKVGVTIREFVTGERYTGFTKAGTRIPVEQFPHFRELINSIKVDDLLAAPEEEKTDKKESKPAAKAKSAKEKQEKSEEIEEEFY